MRGKCWAAALICLGAGILLSGVGCGEKDESPAGTSAGEKPRLLLYSGAGARVGTEALTEAFEERNNARVEVSYGGSGQLLGRISAYQKGDLFMPGARYYVDRAVEKGLAYGGTAETVAYFVPVIFVQKGNPQHIESIRDLAGPGLRVGLGDERASAIGKKTVEILKRSGVATENIRGNVAAKTATVNELGVAVQLGNLDAAIVWDLTARNFSGHGQMVEIPEEHNSISEVPIVVLRSTRRPELARRFVEFVTSQAGRSILREKNFTVSPQ